MYLKVLILTFLAFFMLNLNATVRCKPKKNDFRNYLIFVLQHIERQHEGWLSKKHLIIKHDNYQHLTVSDFLIPRASTKNYIIKLQMFTSFINYRYIEILYTYTGLLDTFIVNCDGYLSMGVTGEFKSCAMQLKSTVEQSADFFDKLLATIAFIDRLDLRILHPEMEKTYTVVDEVDAYSRFFQWKKTQVSFDDYQDIRVYEEKVLKEFSNTKRFLDNNAKPRATALVEKALEVCGYNPNEDFNAEMMSDGSVDELSKTLVMFLSRILTFEYDKMGFEPLIRPQNSDDTFKNLKPPENRWNTYHGIEFLTELLDYPGWSKFTYVGLTHGIKYNGVEYLQTPVDQENYGKIQAFTSRLIKYRYGDLIYYFYCMLLFLHKKCCVEKKIDTMIQTFNPNAMSSFTECVIYTHDSMKTSLLMLKSMMTALQKMKMSKKYIKNYVVPMWPLEAIIQSIITFIEDFELNNFAPSDFNEAIAFQYSESLYRFLEDDVCNKIRNVLTVNNKYCDSASFINYSTYFDEKVLPTLPVMPVERKVSFKMLCELLNKFYRDVISEDFVQLGFHQVII